MKVCVALAVLLAFATAKDLYGSSRRRSQSSSDRDIIQMINKYGYPTRVDTVTTEDGYILDLIRIPHGVKQQQRRQQDQYQNQRQQERQYESQEQENEWTQQQQNRNAQQSQRRQQQQNERSQHQQNQYDEDSEEERNQQQNQKKPVVLLMHGFMSSAEDFVYGGPTHGLAFILADKGFDVYLGNTRGSLYGQKHTRLNPHKDAAFWRFCWHEIGTKDLPSIIDKVLQSSERQHLQYVGHMEGATSFLVMASERPEYVRKVEKLVTLGPIAFIRNSDNKMLQTIADNYKSKAWVIKNVGQNMFNPSNELKQSAKTECMDKQENEKICKNEYFLFNGDNSRDMNKTTLEKVLNKVPSGGSVREVLHFAQLLDSGRFKKYDKDVHNSQVSVKQSKNSIEDYDLTKVTVPTAIFYAPRDAMSSVSDVKTLIQSLPRVFKEEMLTDMTNNLDMLYSKTVSTLNKKVVNALIEKVNRNSDMQ